MPGTPTHPRQAGPSGGRVASVLLSLALLLVAGCLPPHAAPPPSRPVPEHTLIVALDGVGYEIMAEAQARGLFRDFQRPSRVLAPFPTLSIVCFTILLEDLTGFKNPGYDVWYYNPDSGRIEGGTSGDEFERSHAYLWLFDIARRDRFSHNLGYFFPRGSLERELRALEAGMRQAPRPQLAYLLTTDAISHLYGREQILKSLEQISASIARVRRQYEIDTGHPLKVVMFSDHGQDFGPQWRMSDDILRDTLAAAGYHNTDTLKKPGDVIVISYGNVRSGLVYARLEDRPGVAEIIRHQRGVDLTFYRVPGGAVVLDTGTGKARIDCEAGKQRYIPERGDPLGYLAIVEALKAKGELDADGWGSSQSWLEASVDHPYPHALHRICGGFNDIVRYPADILFNTTPGAMFGPWNLEAGSNLAFGGIKGNHGGINRTESSAFIATTDADLLPPAQVSYENAMRMALFRGKAPAPPPHPPLIENTVDRRWPAMRIR